jgi:hypothetical protein
MRDKDIFRMLVLTDLLNLDVKGTGKFLFNILSSSATL